MEIRRDSNPARSILLVEDEEKNLELLTTILAKKYPNVALYAAINGKMALDLFNIHAQTLVITDINMPEMDGVQLAENIRALKPNTRFIVLTGNTVKPILHDSNGKVFEFDHLIMKPFVFHELFAAIEQCLGEYAPTP